MRTHPKRSAFVRGTLAGLTLLSLGGRSVLGQDPGNRYMQVPRIAQTPQSETSPYGLPGYANPTVPDSTTPSAEPSPEGTAGAPPAATNPFSGVNPAAPTNPAGSAFDSALAGEQFAAFGGQTVAVSDNAGYIDSAIIRSRFRQRYDSAYDLNTPDRAEFFYAKCGCFGMGPRSSPFFDPRALGPFHKTAIVPGHPGLAYPGEPKLNYQELTSYLEIAANQKNSGFIELPARFLNPTFGKSTYGFSDMNIGFKHAFIAEPDRFYTFQFRTYVPTGSGEKGLGTNHATVEPGFLVFQRLSDRLYFSGELRDWIPVHATNFAGNILRYGAGLAYNIVLTEHLRVAPVTEFVGWSILSGEKVVPNGNYDPNVMGSLPFQVLSASHDTILNAKFGLRFGLGDYTSAGGGSGPNDRHSLYVGYGQALTGDHWYRNMLRVEYNFWF